MEASATATRTCLPNRSPRNDGIVDAGDAVYVGTNPTPSRTRAPTAMRPGRSHPERPCATGLARPQDQSPHMDTANNDNAIGSQPMSLLARKYSDASVPFLSWIA